MLNGLDSLSIPRVPVTGKCLRIYNFKLAIWAWKESWSCKFLLGGWVCQCIRKTPTFDSQSGKW